MTSRAHLSAPRFLDVNQRDSAKLEPEDYGKEAAIILGAGYSYVAGLPLGSTLFSPHVLISSKGAELRLKRVHESWLAWAEENPGKGSELFLESVREGNCDGVPWAAAVEFIGAALATPRGSDWQNMSFRNPRYTNNITRESIVGEHIEFWSAVLALFNVTSVHTTNYDLLIERCLRPAPTRRRKRPGFYYGGFSQPQVLTGNALRLRNKSIQLTGRIPLFKLHGSLSWQLSGKDVLMLQDCRPAFRRHGESAIVPPVPEKDVPEWLGRVWSESEDRLARAKLWVVCGYSLPEYDVALDGLFARAASWADGPTKIIVMDPTARRVAERWRKVAPFASVVCLSGLPSGTRELLTSVEASGLWAKGLRAKDRWS